MDLTITETQYGADDRSWVGSQHAYDQPSPGITLDSDAFLSIFTDGFVPSGVALGKVTASGLYVPYDDDGTDDGRRVMVGHLKVGRRVKAGHKVGAALYEHGPVIEANLPTNHGLDAAGKADVANRIWYR